MAKKKQLGWVIYFCPLCGIKIIIKLYIFIFKRFDNKLCVTSKKFLKFMKDILILEKNFSLCRIF